MSKYDAMQKDDLRAACKRNGISYGKLTVQGMRDALHAHNAPAAAVTAESVPTMVTTATAAEPAPAAAPVAAAPRKPAPPVDERNGVRKPREGGVCRRVWDWLDANPAAGSKDLKAWATGEGLNANNASIELSRWRKYTGRARPAKEVKNAA